jgi:hypothetical protein
LSWSEFKRRRDADDADLAVPTVVKGEPNGLGDLEGTPRHRQTVNDASGEGDSSRQSRLQVNIDAKEPYFILDSEPISCKSPAAVHFVAALINANGERVSFAEWNRRHPEFEGSRSNRVLRAIPEQVQVFVEFGTRGKEPRLKVEDLAKA